MATIPVYDTDTNRTYTVTATVESSVVAGNNSGKTVYYLKLNTSQKTPAGGSIPDQIVEDIGASDITTTVQDSLELVIQHAEGEYDSSDSSAFLSSSSSKLSSSTQSESTQSESTQSESSRSTSS